MVVSVGEGDRWGGCKGSQPSGGQQRRRVERALNRATRKFCGILMLYVFDRLCKSLSLNTLCMHMHMHMHMLYMTPNSNVPLLTKANQPALTVRRTLRHVVVSPRCRNLWLLVRLLDTAAVRPPKNVPSECSVVYVGSM